MVFTGQELKINLIINRQISGFYRNVTETNVNRFLFVFDKKKNTHLVSQTERKIKELKR